MLLMNLHILQQILALVLYKQITLVKLKNVIMIEPICSTHWLIAKGTSFFRNKQQSFYRTVEKINTTNYQGLNNDPINTNWNESAMEL